MLLIFSICVCRETEAPLESQDQLPPEMKPRTARCYLVAVPSGDLVPEVSVLNRAGGEVSTDGSWPQELDPYPTMCPATRTFGSQVRLLLRVHLFTRGAKATLHTRTLHTIATTPCFARVSCVRI